ncbi:hypothetical protein Q1695_011894 [Nippostrongylus brasiliensis]|nr:hypothetical protein Q1695_011894 [Nippostrongylus brasiliensis]
MGSLDTLPEHVILKVLEYLGGSIDIAKAGLVSRRWYNVSRQDFFMAECQLHGRISSKSSTTDCFYKVPSSCESCQPQYRRVCRSCCKNTRTFDNN